MGSGKGVRVMKQGRKILKGVGIAALAMGLIPYRIRADKASGAFEVKALLWSVEITAGDSEKPAAQFGTEADGSGEAATERTESAE